MPHDEQERAQVALTLERFQEGYARRDPARLDAFMALFVDDAELEVIGTGALTPGEDEWCLGPSAVRQLVASDWEGWGDLEIDTEGARIHILGDVAWVSTAGTVTDAETEEQSIADSLERVRWILGQEMAEEERLLEIVRESTGTLVELRRGTVYVWPIRFAAVLVKRGGRWRFHQMQFSFATAGLPDVRLPVDEGVEV